jgi:chromosome segregation protein
MGALEVGNLDRVSAFAGHEGRDAPPVRLAFYAMPPAGAPVAPAAGLAPLADLLQLHDAGLKAVLADWLQGCYVESDLVQALARAKPSTRARGTRWARTA